MFTQHSAYHMPDEIQKQRVETDVEGVFLLVSQCKDCEYFTVADDRAQSC